jgi:hypothetical protein
VRAIAEHEDRMYAFIQSIADLLPDGIPTVEDLDPVIDALSPETTEWLGIRHLVFMGFEQLVKTGAAERFRDAHGMFQYRMLREKTPEDDAEVEAAFKREHERFADAKATRMLDLAVEMGVMEQFPGENGEMRIRELHKMTEAEREFYNATLQREDKRNAACDAITYLLTTTGAVGWWHRAGLAELDRLGQS